MNAWTHGGAAPWHAAAGSNSRPRESPLNREELKLRLKRLLVEGLKLDGVRPEEVQDAAPIFVEGLGLDSIDALELVVLIEENFRVAIPDEEVGKLAFASIDALADYILQHAPPDGGVH
jgi:acyl carrier protein